MITYKFLLTHPLLFPRLTGHTLPEFEAILDKFKSVYEETLRKQWSNPTRKRAHGAGRPSHITTLEDKLVFILVYVRQYPLLFLQGLLFNLSESNACFWVHTLLPLLDTALGYAHKKPVRPRGRNLEELIRDFPELVELGLLGDGTERPVRKPKNAENRKSHYSGKKKRHTIKNILLTKPVTKEVLYLGNTVDGSIHDKKVIEGEGPSPGTQSKIIPLGLDLGFEGLHLAGFKSILPYKKPKGKELTEVQKSQNKSFSRIRVEVENAICGVKRSHAVADIYRNIKENTDDLLMSVACGLHNIRVAYRYQKR